MPVDTRSSTNKSNMMATSTGDKPTMDARMKSLEEANLNQSSKLESAVDTMRKQLQEMNESILQMRLSTQTTTMISPNPTPTTVNPLTTPITFTLPPNSTISSSYSCSAIPPLNHLPTQTKPLTPKPYFDHTHQLPSPTFMTTQSLPPYPSFTKPYFDHLHHQPLPAFMTIQNPQIYPSFHNQSNPTYLNPSSHQTIQSFSQFHRSPLSFGVFCFWVFLVRKTLSSLAFLSILHSCNICLALA